MVDVFVFYFLVDKGAFPILFVRLVTTHIVMCDVSTLLLNMSSEYAPFPQLRYKLLKIKNCFILLCIFHNACHRTRGQCGHLLAG